MSRVVSYAQNREDLYIASYFPDVTDGFYVDIGTHDPIHDSVTKHFYNEGWTGINVEPQEELFKKIVKDRKKDINLNVGVSNAPGSLKLREYPGGGLSTFSDEIKKAYEGDDSMKSVEYREYEVQVTTLKKLLSEHAPKHIHFMKVDVEGLEYEVLESNDWKKFRPELICIEANHVVKDWRPILKKANYYKVLFDGLNEYYLAEESKYREKLFCYPAKFLSSGTVVPYEYAWQFDAMKKELKGLYKAADKSNALIAEKDRTIVELNESKRLLEVELSRLQTVKGAVRHSGKVVKNKAIGRGKK